VARFDGGWVKIYRKIYGRGKQDNEFYGDGRLRDLFVTLIVWANMEPTTTQIGGKPQTIGRGQLLTSYRELSACLGISLSTVKRGLDYLVQTERISIKYGTRRESSGSIITILNYDKFQGNNENTEQDVEQAPNKRQYKTRTLLKKERNKEIKNTSLSEVVGKPDGEKFPIPESDPGPNPRKLVELWNEIVKDPLPQVNLKLFKPGSPRWKSAKARLEEMPDLDYWRQVIERISKSDFCNGKNDRGWKANMEFLIRQETHVKAMEGAYDNRVGINQAGIPEIKYLPMKGQMR
jgi:hypothetical protein